MNEIKLKKRILDFLREFSETCRKAGKNPDSVKILYAAKYLNPGDFVMFLHIMQEIDRVPVIIGENRVQAMEEKMEFLNNTDDGLTDSFYPVMIGFLQKNKINKALGLFREIHSVDSLELAGKIDKRERVPVYLEVNISGETTKHGIRPEELSIKILEFKKLRNLEIKGLMTMGPLTENSEEIRGVYRKLKELADRYGLLTSMGMSGDWKIAVEEGTDMIRVGNRVFGQTGTG